MTMTSSPDVRVVLELPPLVRRLDVALPELSADALPALSPSPAVARFRLLAVCFVRVAPARVLRARSSSESSIVMTVSGAGLREEEPFRAGTGVARALPFERVLGAEGVGVAATGTGAGGGGGGGFAYNRVHSRAVLSC